MTSPAGDEQSQKSERWPGAVWIAGSCLLAGAAYLAITRADALMLDVAKIVGCF